MPTFNFKGRSASGNAVNGKIEAMSSDAAAGQLLERGITPININELIEGGRNSIDLKKYLVNKPTLEELLFFSRQMYSLTKAGVPLVKSLNSLLETTKNPLMAQAMIDIVAGLDGGREFSAAMLEHPKVFNNLFVSMVHVGENTGQLEEAFMLIAQNIEREIDTRARIKSATRYPIFVISAMVVAMVIINIMVIPKFAATFKSFKAELPVFTKILVGTSDMAVNDWPYVLVIIVAAIFAMRSYLQTKNGRFAWDKGKLKLPIFGSIIHRALLTRFAYTFSMTLRAGVPISDALDIAAKSETNTYFSSHIKEMRTGIERGEPLIRVASASGLFTPVVLQMISVGEESGMVDAMLQEVGEFYEREVDYDLQRLSASLEPILLSVIGAMVLVLALGIFLPMWDLGKAALHQ
jgi:MSHA biogenesis protein MshG